MRRRTAYLAPYTIPAPTVGLAYSGLGGAGIMVASDFAPSPTAGIQEAIGKLPSTGGVVYIPGGTHTIEAAINAGKPNVTLQGAGPSTVLRNEDASNHRILNVIDSPWFTIRDLALDGNKATHVADQYGLAMSGCDDATIERVVARDCSEAAFYLMECERANILYPRILNCDHRGIRLKDFCHDALIAEPYVYGTVKIGAGSGHDIQVGSVAGTTTGVRIVAGRCMRDAVNTNDSSILLGYLKDSSVTGGHYHSYMATMWIMKSENVIVEGATCKSDTDNGITFSESPRCKGNNNICYECGYSGLVFTGSNDCEAVGNKCYDNGQALTANKRDGIQVTHTATINPTGVGLFSNRCFDTGGGTQQYGITIRGNSDYCTALANDCRANATAPYLNESSNSVILRTLDKRMALNEAVTASVAFGVGGTTGAVLLPRLTTAQRNALAGTNGMIIYNTDNNRIEGYEAGAWVDL